jgi:(p)ppGpp synthase/HD superfamily hydrolase
MSEKMKHLAYERHSGYFRKGDNPKPYITHPEAVVNRLLSWGIPEDSPLIDAAWGHDLIEDVQVPKEEIVAASSEEVWQLIDMLTYKPEQGSKEDYIQKVADSGNRSALLVKAADRLSNTLEFIETFSRERARTYIHYADSVLEALKKLPQDDAVSKALAEWNKLMTDLDSDK